MLRVIFNTDPVRKSHLGCVFWMRCTFLAGVFFRSLKVWDHNRFALSVLNMLWAPSCFNSVVFDSVRDLFSVVSVFVYARLLDVLVGIVRFWDQAGFFRGLFMHNIRVAAE